MRRALARWQAWLHETEPLPERPHPPLPEADPPAVYSAGVVRLLLRTAAISPELAGMLREQVEDDDELLLHLLMGDLCRWAEERAATHPSDAHLRALLEVLESEFSRRDDQVDDAVAVSFVEHLDDAVVVLLGPALAEQSRAFRAPQP
jgi:hypothetical protein